MKGKIQKVVWVFLWMLWPVPSLWASENPKAVEWDDMSLYTYVWNNGRYLEPYFRELHESEKTLYFRLPLSRYPQGRLEICWPANSVLAWGPQQKSWLEKKGCRSFDVDSLARVYTQEALVFSLFNEHLKPGNWSAKILKDTPSEAEGESIINLLEPRPKDVFGEHLTLLILLLSAFMAVMWRFYPKVFAEFFRIIKALSLRGREESIANMRLVTIPSLLTLLFVSLSSAILFIIILHFSNQPIFAISGAGFPSFGLLVLSLLQWTGMFFVSIVLKYYLVRNFATMFKIPEFANSHFFNFMRFHLVIFGVGLLVAWGAYFGFSISESAFYLGLLKAVMWAVGGAILIVFLKLLYAGSFRIFHLFSYICATEILPLFILIKLTWS
jgi:hypothetical protein